MSDIDHSLTDGDLGALAPPAVPPPPPFVAPSPKERRRALRPRNLLAIAVAVAVGSVGGTLLANRLSDSGSGGSDQGMGQWMASYGTHYLTVSHDLAAVSSAANASQPDVSTVLTACERLRSEVDTSQSDPPMPASSLAPLWSSILTSLHQGSQACISGIGQHSATQITRMQDDFQQASTTYERLLEAIQKIN